jgi:hypothetical protein
MYCTDPHGWREMNIDDTKGCERSEREGFVCQREVFASHVEWAETEGVGLRLTVC